MRILAINPGSTSTKIAVFNNIDEIFTKTIRHNVEELAEFPRIIDQYEFRKRTILNSLDYASIQLSSIDAIVGIGGLVKPIQGGVYRVNDIMIEDIRKEILGEHASNLGAILAKELAEESGKKIGAYIVDPVVVDEMEELARFSGHPEIPRASIFHALNQKAVARRFAREKKLDYNKLKLIVVHLGGGLTVGVHKNGKVIDVNNGLDGDGPFSAERTGSLPVGALVKLCFSGKYQINEIKKMITGKGGLVAYLNTNNAFVVEERINSGDKYAETVYKAMAYQIAKEIGACSTVIFGDIDAILITGGMANSDMIINWIKERVSFLAPIYVYPGEDEMKALAEGVYYVLTGEIPLNEYY